jgi:hypothetical protein
MSTPSHCAIFMVLVSVMAPLGNVSADDEIDFSRDILPLLSNNCFQCHGPDEEQREAELRLDVRERALAELESGAIAIVPSKSQASAVVERITAEDESERMPPPDSGKKLSDDEIARIVAWIDAGAMWGKHWAFQPPKSPQLSNPVAGWRQNNPVDQFIHATLQKHGLQPEVEADKRTLIRRVTFDLTGLPPTVDQINWFLADQFPGAYERLLDRLFASPRYGEHMARIWLDAARYGDTHGLHLDNERSIWPYREWVISSFNQNMPFDQFTIEQLAGDLLPQPTLSQRVATGFNRCNVTTSEGGSIDEEYYMRYAVDRVETTATVWLGLTAGCAACHDHKFDPLTQKEFYQLFSYFFSLTERAMDGNALLPPPVLKVPTAEQLALKTELQDKLRIAEETIEAAFEKVAYMDPSVGVELGDLTQRENIWFDDELPEGAVKQGNGAEPWKFVSAPEHPVHSGENSSTRTADGLSQHFFTGAKTKLTIGENDRLFAYVFLDPKNPPETVQLQFNDGSWEHRAHWGADKTFGIGRKNASNRPMGPLPELGKWVKLEVAASDVGLKPGAKLNGWAFTQFGGTVHWDQAGVVSASLSDQQLRSQYAWEQFRKQFKGPAVPKEVKKILDVEREKRTTDQQQQLTRYYIEHINPDTMAILQGPLDRKAGVERKLQEVDKAIPATLVMEDRKKARQAHILERGQYTEKRGPVKSAVPTWILPMAENAPMNRMGLAQWLVDPSHPLTSRVTVNRMWQQFFGIGIVRTSEDFGVQGEQPSHPKLLDWMALRFVESGWDVKAFQKMLLMSATYRQSSRLTTAKLAADPENRLLSCGPRFRLDGEVIRDQALAVSGLLVGRIGGKSGRPYQPDGLWKPVGFGGSNTSVFKQDHGVNLYRRSMYTFLKRTSPPPSMTTFDAPNRETCQVRRSRTNTPLQALVLMNDVQFFEAARKFAERVMTEGGQQTTSRLDWAFCTVTARHPSPRESAMLLAMFASYQEDFRNDREAAEKLLKAGESSRNVNLDVVDLAAWSMVTHLLLNLSETITKG